VHVTQGTFANADPTALLVTCLEALADEPVRVVATTGGRPVDGLVGLLGGGLPANAVVAELVAYADLLPHTALMVTNGGWGGVQQALAHGVPVVVAGSSEEKPEVAARVAWSGAGVDLGTGRPSHRRIRQAVRAALRRPRHRAAAQRLQAEYAAMPDPVDVVAAAVLESARVPVVRTT
jgi:UDP:flavonoid glycosyltransferase YjiC (YdhE family)